MPGRFTFFSDTISGKKILFNEIEFQHAIQTLRYKTDDIIEVTDGTGNLHQAKISLITKKFFEAEILETKQLPPLKKMSIAVGILRLPDRMEWMVEKCAELGVSNLQFFAADYSVKKTINPERLEKINIHALKQSHGAWKMQIGFFENVKKIPTNNYSKIYFGSDKVISHEIINYQMNNTLIIIGPEGDFSKNEMSFFELQNWSSLQLGNSVLRTETAVIAAAVKFLIP